MILNVLYEDRDIIVVEKPVGVESQSSRGFAVDMVSEIKKHIHKSSPKQSGQKGDPYVGVIHRLDKPVGGVMIYAKTPRAAAALSDALRQGFIKKQYLAVVCGKPVDNHGELVDYMLKSKDGNYSEIVDKKTTGAKMARLNYQVMDTRSYQEETITLVKVDLLTGRHHQIRVQFAGQNLPLWGDRRYHLGFADSEIRPRRETIALAAWSLSFPHPSNGKIMQFQKLPSQGIFSEFEDILILYK